MPIHPYLLLPTIGNEMSDEWNRLGIAAHQQNNPGQAQAYYQRALSLNPRHAAACQNLAVLYACNPVTTNEASLAFERASMCDGKFAIIPANRAILSIDQERVDDAEEQARKAVEIDPKDCNALKILAMILTSAGKPEEAIETYNRALDIDPKDSISATNACFVQTLTKATPTDLRKQRDRWYQAHKFEGQVAPHVNDRNASRPLRVGYVGGDFKCHSAAFIFSRVLLNHTPDVEMYLYSSLPVDPAADVRTKAFQEKCGPRWRDISTKTDEEADRMIREDKIDILVDLAAHTHGGRLGIFCRKPAPIQVTAWGFAHGTGVPQIDYFFADENSVGPEERQHYAEKVWDLPCQVSFMEPTEYNIPATSKPPYQRNDYITFGSFARFEKFSDECLSSFAEILRRVPDSKLMFKDNSMKRPDSLRRIQRLMPDIAQERLLFGLTTSHNEHILAYQQLDLFLNPWPHSGGCVALEVLYSGVPVCALFGTQPGGRTAASILRVMGHADWVAGSPQEYIEKAVYMAENQSTLLAPARKVLRSELLESPVVKDYHLAVEAAYRQMWQEYCAK